MDTVLGLKGSDFVMLAADTMVVKTLMVLKDSEYQAYREIEYEN